MQTPNNIVYVITPYPTILLQNMKHNYDIVGFNDIVLLRNMSPVWLHTDLRLPLHTVRTSICCWSWRKRENKEDQRTRNKLSGRGINTIIHPKIKNRILKNTITIKPTSRHTPLKCLDCYCYLKRLCNMFTRVGRTRFRGVNLEVAMDFGPKQSY